MSTENEGNAVPPAPSAPPVPVASPDASPQGTAPEGNAQGAPRPPVPQENPAAPAGQGTGTAPAGQGAAPAGSAPEGSWPPPPQATPSYGSYGDGAAYGVGGPSYGGDAGSPGAGGPGAGWGASWQQPAPKPRGGRGGLVAAVLVAALVAGGLGGGLGYTLAKDRDDRGSTTVSAPDSATQVKRAPGTIANVAAKALPSTVTIQAESSDGEGGTGTGFVFDTQGHIVTNNHVVAEAVDGGRLTATFPSGKKYDAEVVGHAQGYDVAVIKLKNAPSDLRPLALGDSDKVAVGDETIAIGAPFGLSNTVTTGIISAKDRPVASSDGSSTSKASYMSALQTDASINPGNSGGPLLDASGAVIGINSAIQSTGSGGFGTGQSGSIGLGFAIPINQAKYVAQQLIKTGKPVYAKIGASVSLEDSSDGAKITDQGTGGAAAVESGGPADKAGLKPGDVITKLDDHVIDSGPTLIGEIWTHQPGDKVTITYKRGGQERTADLTLGAREGDS
ncbi:S1C family serine protease [Streptomyces lavenduligriseus]|uniref:Trypsin-like peptidase domain-containing protein n=1 Tax=Streptomyces lavenduligriseus TaxID=67315 RepID=A0ABT0NNG3_9ACTN|nr:trypsin-like peptidase domain-containing protein [Streptomyces lavenduligriseus]MCL3992843.1 trypsin-like peptidase domain-containing protein [Streptomyces lavenduligriseus]